MIVVTSGGNYTDIDAYGGCIAYAALLQLEGKAAVAVLEPTLNASIPPYLRKLPVHYSKLYQEGETDTFVIIDTSDPATFASFVELKHVEEVIDHHPGFERYWGQHKKVKTQIEVVGAACTQIFERWGSAGRLQEMSAEIAELLMAGILDNTLGLKASITHQRDIDAYHQLQAITGDHGRFMEQYFEDCQREIEQNVAGSIRNDIKTLRYPAFGLLKTGQLAVWEGSELITTHLTAISAEMGDDCPWVCNVISICEGKSSLISNDVATQTYFSNLLSVTFDDRGVAEANRLWLRKEIMKKAIERHGEIL